MEVEFDDHDLDRLETDPQFTAGLSQEIVRAYRKRMQQIRAFRDERDFMSVKSLHFEKLKGNRAGQHSIRLNLQWRLALEIRGSHPCKKSGDHMNTRRPAEYFRRGIPAGRIGGAGMESAGTGRYPGPSAAADQRARRRQAGRDA
ncbi:relE-like toxin of type II toxin-antitoxin system higB domain-containing protein [Ditylenchus destructor]|nr:relE-like toxin of type II toxin-antitoxin system higB domain-containing protein [Ditylenchus destructor]